MEPSTILERTRLGSQVRGGVRLLLTIDARGHFLVRFLTAAAAAVSILIIRDHPCHDLASFGQHQQCPRAGRAQHMMNVLQRCIHITIAFALRLRLSSASGADSAAGNINVSASFDRFACAATQSIASFSADGINLQRRVVVYDGGVEQFVDIVLFIGTKQKQLFY